MPHRLLAALLLAAAPAAAFADPGLDAEEVEFLRLLNEYRGAQSPAAPCLSPSPTMNEAADFMSQAMGEQGFFDHDEPSGRGPFTRIADFGHQGWTTAGENLLAGGSTAAEAFAMWQASAGHDRNMRDPRFIAIGIGRVEVPGSPYGVYWTTDFSDLADGDLDCATDAIVPGVVEPGEPRGPGGAVVTSGGGSRHFGCSAGGTGLAPLGLLAIALAIAGHSGRRRRPPCAR